MELVNRWRGAARRGATALATASCCGALFVFARELHGHYPIDEWLVWRVGLLWWYLLLFTSACVGGGVAVLRRLLREPLPVLETWLISQAVGLAIFGLLLYAAGAIGALHPAFAIAMPVALIALTRRDLRWLVVRTLDELRESRTEESHRLRVLRIAASGFAMVALAVLYAIAFTPDAISLDAAWYHFPVAHDYARAGRLLAFPSEYNKALPHLDSMIYCWGFLLPGITRPFDWMMALHLEYAILLWKIVGVGVGAQWLLGEPRLRGLWLGFFLSPMVFTFAHSVTGGAEHFVGLWAVPMLVITGRMLRAFDLRMATLLGVLSGGAILSKYQAIYMIAGCGTAIVGRWVWCVAAQLRGKPCCAPERLWRAPILIMGVGLLVASPHFLKNAFFYGDPLYPFLQAKIAGVHPTHDLADYLFHAKLGDPDNRPKLHGLARLTESLRLFADFSFSPHYVVVKQKWPVIGSLFTLLLPCVLLLRGTARIWLASWCSFVAIAVWSNTYLQDRYLNAVSTIFLAAAVALIVKLWRLSTLVRVPLTLLILLQVFWGLDAFVYSGNSLIESTVKLARSGYEGRLDPVQRYPWYRTFDRVNELTPEDAQILVRGTRKTLGIDRLTHRDVLWHQANIWYEPLRNVGELWQHYRDLGITHVLYNRDVQWAGNLQSSVLVDQLIVHGGGERHEISGKWELVALPAERPPGDAPLLVLTLGAPLYRDGLYEADALRLYGPTDRATRGAAEPTQLAAPETVVQLARRADVVAMGVKVKLSAEARAAIEARFERFETVEDIRIYVRQSK